MNETNLRLWLKGRETVTIPELQQGYAGSYSRAKRLLRSAIARFWISEEPDGLQYRVNCRSLSRGKPTPDGFAAILRGLIAQDLYWLREAQRNDNGYAPLRLSLPSREHRIEPLLKMGVIHEFCGQYFLSVDDETLRRILDCFVAIPESPLLCTVAYPILCTCLTMGKDPEPLLKLGFIPTECSHYIRGQLPKLRRRGVHPLSLASGTNEMKCELLKFELIEAFIRTHRLETKEEYDRLAEAERDAILQSPLCSQALKDGVAVATEEIIHELTLTNIQEIYRLIAS